jgi:hypothetical protein
MEAALATLLINLVSQHPILASIVGMLGIARMINKPLFALLRAYVLATPNPADDLVLDRVEASKAKKAVDFALDYAFSIKPKAQAK